MPGNQQEETFKFTNLKGDKGTKTAYRKLVKKIKKFLPFQISLASTDLAAVFSTLHLGYASGT